MIKIAGICGFDLKEVDILTIYRLKLLKNNNSSDERNSQDRTPSIIVKFVPSFTHKDKIFKNYIQMLSRKLALRCDSIGINSHKRIYLNHHLSPELLIVRDKAIAYRKLGVIEKAIPQYNYVKILSNGKWMKIINQQQLQEIDDIYTASLNSHGLS